MIIVIMGVAGAGKSTLGELLAGVFLDVHGMTYLCLDTSPSQESS